MLPPAVRSRQLKAATLLTGMMLALADGRPAHLTRAREALLALPEDDQARAGQHMADSVLGEIGGRVELDAGAGDGSGRWPVRRGWLGGGRRS